MRPAGLSSIVSASEITDNDVLCGRGRALQSHTGNMHFRDLVVERSDAYGENADNKTFRRRVAMEIVSIVQGKGGRFLKRIPDESTDMARLIGVSGDWKVADLATSLTKVKQALRDTVSSDARKSKHISNPEASTVTPSQESRNKPARQTGQSGPAHPIPDFVHAALSSQVDSLAQSASVLDQLEKIKRQISSEQENARLRAQPYLLGLRQHQRQGPQRPEVIPSDLTSAPRLFSNQQFRQGPLSNDTTWALSSLLQHQRIRLLMMSELSRFSSPLRDADTDNILLQASMLNATPTIGNAAPSITGVGSTSHRSASPTLQARRLFASQYTVNSPSSSQQW